MTQDRAFEIIMQGENVFLTGKAGTGKTYLLNKAIDALEAKGKNVARTATTGVAATHINGKTIHSWAGIGIKDILDEEDLFKIVNNRFVSDKIHYNDVLVIDEISMFHDFRLDMVDRICKMVKRRPDAPFGGMQVILCGDFFQLPPVTKGKSKNYTFNALSWQEADFKVCYLEKIYRQSGDMVLTDILNAIRGNYFDNAHKEIIAALSKNKTHFDEAINLYCKNIDVKMENMSRLEAIAGEPDYHNYTSNSRGNTFLCEMIVKNWNAEKELIVRTGAKVMFLVNHTQGEYFNGTMGTIIDFLTPTEFEEKYVRDFEAEDFNDDARAYPVVKLFNKNEKGKDIVHAVPHEWKLKESDRLKMNHLKDAIDKGDNSESEGVVAQVPLKLAYAITIHKSQGCSFDYVNLSLEDVFEMNMGYVALSRVRSLDGLYLSGFNYIATKVDPVVMHKYLVFESMSRENEINA